MTGGGRLRAPLVLLVLAAAGALFILLPLLGLVARAPWGTALSELTSAETLDALRLSLVTSVAAAGLALVLGVPLAWVQARLRFPGQRLLRALTTLPMVVPPVVGGVALLLAFGRRGLVGQALDQWFGIRIAFTTLAVVLAETFVALPFMVLTVEAGLRSMDHRLEDAARTLGAKPWTVFARITLPAIAPSLYAGAVLSWARALGEFGATVTFAGSFPGRTQTLPLAVYAGIESRPDGAIMLSLLLVVIAVGVLVLLRHRWLETL